MNAPVRAAIFAAGLALLLASCSGGLSGPSTPPAGNAPASAPNMRARHGSLRIAIAIPKKHRSGHHRAPKYISPATQSMTIDVTGPTPVNETVNLTVNSGNCSSTLASTVCTLTIPGLSPGNYAASISTYDGTNGSGNLLSSAQSVPFTIVAGQSNAVDLTLGGIVASLAVTPITPFRLSGSTSTGFNVYGNTPVTFSVMPLDADNNVIVGAGAPAPSVSPAAGAQMTVVPGTAASTWKLTSSYQPTDPEAPSNASITVTATPFPGSGGSTVSATIPFALYQPWIYVSDLGGGIEVFDEQGNAKSVTGSTPFSDTSNSAAILYDSHNGWLYALSEGGAYGYSAHAYDREGNLQTLSAASPFANLKLPAGIAQDPVTHAIYITNYFGPYVLTFDEQGNRITSPAYRFPGLSLPVGIAFATHPNNDYVYVTDRGPNALLKYCPCGTYYGMSASGSLFNPTAVSFDAHNNLVYVANSSGNDVIAFNPASIAQPLGSCFSNLDDPQGVAWDPYDGLIYVGNSNGTVNVCDENGNSVTVTGSFAGIGDAGGFAAVR